MIHESSSRDLKDLSLKSFWVVLEFRLSGELYNTSEEYLQGFSCEGIFLSPDDPQLRTEKLSDTRKITTTAWLGIEGQDEYQATLHFGPKALNCYAENLPLEDSIPNYTTNGSWFEIDPNKKTIAIQLL